MRLMGVEVPAAAQFELPRRGAVAPALEETEQKANC